MSMNQSSHSCQNEVSIHSSDPVMCATESARHGAPELPVRTANFATMNSRFWNAA